MATAQRLLVALLYLAFITLGVISLIKIFSGEYLLGIGLNAIAFCCATLGARLRRY